MLLEIGRGRQSVGAPDIVGMKKAKEQVEQYGDALERKYKSLKLKRYAVVSLGFERICWKEILR